MVQVYTIKQFDVMTNDGQNALEKFKEMTITSLTAMESSTDIDEIDKIYDDYIPVVAKVGDKFLHIGYFIEENVYVAGKWKHGGDWIKVKIQNWNKDEEE